MWVLSQSGKTLGKPESFHASEKTIYAHIGGSSIYMGEYNSEEEAIGVLKDIAACIGKGVEIFRMP
jgi:hypothetical protein